MKRLDGKMALVTGSSRSIGEQIALGLARLGCGVIVHARRIENLGGTLEALSGLGVPVHGVSGDLGRAEGVTELIAQVRSVGVPVDILYNNAAIQNDWKPIWEITREEWLGAFQTNVFAMVDLCTAFAPGMRERGFGRIINLTSGIKDQPNLAPYSVSKAAVDKYTRDLAYELRDTNVLVNALDPGWLRTDMGGPQADHDVETVLPGALVPALLEDFGPTGKLYAAQDFKYLA